MLQEFITNCFLWCFRQFRKKSWKLVSGFENQAEEIYRKEEQLIVLVNQEELGKKLYEIVRVLQVAGTKIQLGNKTLQVYECYTDRQKNVKAFCIRIIEDSFHYGKKASLLRVQELADFVESLQKEGYNLNQADFQQEEELCLSSLLAAFEQGGNEEETKVLLIPYIHRQLSGESLEETYQKVKNQNAIIAYTKFPYELPLIRMCYQYFSAGIMPESISRVIEEERTESTKSRMGEKSFLVASLMVEKKDLSQQFAIIEQTNQFTLYEGNFKIYSTMPEGFAEYLKHKQIARDDKRVVEEVSHLLINFDGEVIGYQFTEQKLPEVQNLLKGFKTSYEVLMFFTKLVDWLSLLKGNIEPNKQQNSSQEQLLNPFELKQDVLWSWSYFSEEGPKFRLTTVQTRFYLENLNVQLLWQQILELFFQWYENLLIQKYGSMQEEEQFYRKVEIRYLNPILAQEFVQFTLKRKCDGKKAVKELFSLLKAERKETEVGDYYDARFQYDPQKIPFLFTYDAERKYGVSLKEGMRHPLPEGRTLVTFQKAQTISSFKQQVDKRYQAVTKKFESLEGGNIVLAGISEVIYSKESIAEGMYKVVGYVTESSKGNVLSMKFLQSLNNKELYQILDNLFSKFNQAEICWEAIRVDKNMVCTIELLHPRFDVFKSRTIGTSSHYVSYVCQELEKVGYNPNAFYVDSPYGIVNLRDSSIRFFGYGSTRNFIAALDAYCEEHGIYYAAEKEICPICSKTRVLVDCSKLKGQRVLLETIGGSHYQLTGELNLKVCKGDSQWMAELEANVDTIVANGWKGEVSLGQGCFIPVKKAVDQNKQFVGYTYPAIALEGKEIVNLGNIEGLGNLARLKGIQRLMEQVDGNLRRGLAFIKNPYGEVFIKKGYKYQVQIENISYLSPEGSKQDTLEWTCRYIHKLIEQDKNLEAVIPANYCHARFEELLEMLASAELKLTQYCKIHRMYYSDDKKFCPRCLDERSLKRLLVEVEPEVITQQTPIAKGGESFIYPFGKKHVAKVFKREVISTTGKKQPADLMLKTIVLARVMDKKPILRKRKDDLRGYHYMYPQKLLADSQGELFAYLMKKVEGGRPLSDLRDTKILEEIGFSLLDTLEVLINVGNGIEELHKNGIYIGDLNGRNILFDQKKQVYFLEFDGMGIDEIPTMFCTEGFIDPQSQKTDNITMKDDWYSFAVQAFYYLFLTHPFSGYYEEIDEKGNKIELLIPDKMERKISLLGNHGLEAPSVARSWDWMREELRVAFLNTFEGDLRINIVPYLEDEYRRRTGETINLVSQEKQIEQGGQILQAVQGTEAEDEEEQEGNLGGAIRINAKFLATQQKPFACKSIVRLINSFSAIIRTQEDKVVLAVLVDENGQKKQYHINGINHFFSSEVFLIEKQNLVIIVDYYEIIAYCLNTSATIYQKSFHSNICNVTINENTLYYVAESSSGEEARSIYQSTFLPDGQVKEEEIQFLPQKETKRFLAKFNSKFVIVKEDKIGSDAVYCNRVRFCNMDYNSESCRYNIIYDEDSKEWLVISSEGNGIIIKTNGSKISITIPKKIVQEMEVENISFRKRVIYIPGEDCLHILKVKEGQLVVKDMVCHKIMTPQSKLYNITSQGFSVMNSTSQEVKCCLELDNTLYEIRKG